MEPVAFPEQGGLVGVLPTVKTDGSVMVIVLVVLHPLASLTVTV